MKYSKQREIILNAVRLSADHPTADEIYNSVREEHPKISLGTVYRNLNLLDEQGIITKIVVPSASDRFDHCTDMHCHLVCEYCGKIIDCDIDCLTNAADFIQKELGFTVDFQTTVLRGVCRDCHELKHEEE